MSALPDRPYLDAAILEIQDYHRSAEDYLAAVEERYDTGVREREEALREVGRLRARVEELEAPEDPVIYLLWSGRHDAWWAPDERGYVASIERAGRYNRADAVRCVVQSAQCGIREQVTSMVAAPDNWTAAVTSVDDVIQPGQPIPANVTEARDRHGDRWIQLLDRTWRCVEVRGEPWDGTPVSWQVISGAHGPLTVTAVREQPAEPKRCASCGEQNPPGGCNIHCPTAAEPQQADASPLLDLVQQLRMRVLNWAGNEIGVVEADEAAGQLDRIAALVPQQPVQARNCLGEPFWQHDFCGEVYSDRKNHERFCDPDGPWRPLLVGGDPAPEHEDLLQARLALESATEELAQTRAEVERLSDERDEAVTDRESARGALRRVAAERDEARARMLEHLGEAGEARAEVERLKRDYVTGKTWREQREAHLAEQRAAQPDPLMLSRPEAPEGTEALVGVDGDRYRWIGDGSDQWEAIEPRPGWRGQLGALLDREGTPVRVELAAPREPRTAAEIWAGLDADERARVTHVADFIEASELAEALDREAGL